MTDKDLQEFWEWCGFTQNKQNYGRGSEYLWNYPDSQVGTLPSIDLNNLFKYAVPKLHAWTMGSCPDGDICAVAVVGENRGEYCGKDPALALYQAIQKARSLNKEG